jgi:osmotically-inducible protein OsmY
VDVDRNVVTLRGTVETAMEKAEAERIAKETEGVTRVNNQLKVGKVS